MDDFREDKLLAQIEMVRRMMLEHLALLRKESGVVQLAYVGEFEIQVRAGFKMLRDAAVA